MISVKFPIPQSRIKKEATRLRGEMMRIHAEQQQVLTLLKQVELACDHKGQETGHNERDGSWGNPCPSCGYSY